MTQIYFSTYEGDLIGYNMSIDDNKVQMEQIFNSPECKHPIRNLVVIGKQLILSSNNNVNIYEVTGGNLTNTIETKYHIKLLMKIQSYFLTVGDQIMELWTLQGQVLRTYHTKSVIVDVKRYSSAAFLALTKCELLAFGLSTGGAVSSLSVQLYGETFLELAVFDAQHVALMSDRKIVYLSLKTCETLEFTLQGRRVFNALLPAGGALVVGTKDAALMVLDASMTLRQAWRVPGGLRPKKLFSITPDVICCLCNNGAIMFFILDDDNALLLLHQKQLTRNIIAGAALEHKDEDIEEIEEVSEGLNDSNNSDHTEEFETDEDIEEFEEFEELEESGEKPTENEER